MGKVNMDIIGEKFNFLTVLNFNSLNNQNKALFECICDCGTSCVLIGSEVKSGKIKSCGCYKAPIKEKRCVICDELFQPTGRCAKYCSDCKSGIFVEMKKQHHSDYMRKRRYKQAVKNGTLDRYGIGRGGGQATGMESPFYKSGIKYFHKRSKEIRKEKRYCERCGKDLKGATRNFWCVHHKDGNRENNVDENFELLCKRCHQIEHECWKALPQNKINLLTNL